MKKNYIKFLTEDDVKLFSFNEEKDEIEEEDDDDEIEEDDEDDEEDDEDDNVVTEESEEDDDDETKEKDDDDVTEEPEEKDDDDIPEETEEEDVTEENEEEDADDVTEEDNPHKLELEKFIASLEGDEVVETETHVEPDEDNEDEHINVGYYKIPQDEEKSTNTKTIVEEETPRVKKKTRKNSVK